MKHFAKPLVFLASVVLSLLAFEIGVRFLEIDYNPSPNWRFHPRLGWTQERGMTYDYQLGGVDIRVEFNQLGFRDVEHALAKPAGTQRLVVIGDSFSEALQVNLEQTYWRQLAKLLSDAQGHPWEVINLGVGDWGNAQALLALKEYGLAYQPDLVVSQFFALNDVCNNTIELAHLCKSTNDDYRPYFKLEEGRLEQTWTQPIRQWLRSRLISFGALELLMIKVAGQEGQETVEEKHQRLTRERGFRSDPLLLTYASDRHQPEELQRGWATTEALLGETFRICRDQGIPWVGMVVPFEARINESWPHLEQALAEFEPDVDYPEKRLGRLFQELGASLLLLKPLFEEHREEVLYFIGGHLNPRGHTLAAEGLRDLVLESGVLQSTARR